MTRIAILLIVLYVSLAICDEEEVDALADCTICDLMIHTRRPRPEVPYVSNVYCTEQLTDCKVTQPDSKYFVTTSYHHVIPSSTLISFWDMIVGHTDSGLFRRTTKKLFSTLNTLYKRNGGRNPELVEVYSEGILSGAITHGGRVKHTQFGKLEGRYNWPSNMLFLGPSSRSDDPKYFPDTRGFEIECIPIIGDIYQDLRSIFERMRDMIDTPSTITESKVRDIFDLMADLMLYEEEYWPIVHNQWDYDGTNVGKEYSIRQTSSPSSYTRDSTHRYHGSYTKGRAYRYYERDDTRNYYEDGEISFKYRIPRHSTKLSITVEVEST